MADPSLNPLLPPQYSGGESNLVLWCSESLKLHLKKQSHAFFFFSRNSVPVILDNPYTSLWTLFKSFYQNKQWQWTKSHCNQWKGNKNGRVTVNKNKTKSEKVQRVKRKLKVNEKNYIEHWHLNVKNGKTQWLYTVWTRLLGHTA